MLFVSLFILFAIVVEAHVRWSHPKPRSNSAGIKGPYPCGSQGFWANGHPTTTLQPGKQVLKIDETVYHTGAPMRIAISMNNDNGFDDHVLLAHIPHPDNAPRRVTNGLEIVVDIPNVKCDKCSLQLLSIMTDKIGNGNCCSYPTSSFRKCQSVYHSCANVKITGTGSSLPASPPNVNVWAVGEGSQTAFSKKSENLYRLDKPYVQYTAARCTCNANRCSRNNVNNPPMVTPLSLSAPATTPQATPKATPKPTSTPAATPKATPKATPGTTPSATPPSATPPVVSTPAPPTAADPAGCTAVSDCKACVNHGLDNGGCKFCPVNNLGCIPKAQECGGSLRNEAACDQPPVTQPTFNDPNNCFSATSSGCAACLAHAGGETATQDKRCKWCPVGDAPICMPYQETCGGSVRSSGECASLPVADPKGCRSASNHQNKCSACLFVGDGEIGGMR